MAPGFKPVGWIAAVAGAAIGCYMLSLNVASERADLLKIERQIIATKQDIRTLQTELGTRGRLAQLETWNAEVLALSAPTTGQFLEDEIKLARFDRQAPTIADRAEVQMASAEIAQPQSSMVEAPVVQASTPVVPVANPRRALVHQASLTLPTPPALPASPERPMRPAKPAVAVTAKPQAAATQPGKPAKPAAPVAASARPTKPAAPVVASAKPVKPVVLAEASVKPVKPVVLASVSIKPAKGTGAAPAGSAPTAAASKPAKPSRSSGSRLDGSLARELGAAAKLESSRSNR
jgi:hypothetical protein